jgi:hypothetical protein
MYHTAVDVVGFLSYGTYYRTVGSTVATVHILYRTELGAALLQGGCPTCVRYGTQPYRGTQPYSGTQPY